MKLLRENSIQTPCYQHYIPIDVDVSVLDNSGNKKEGVSKTYKLVDGYAPIFAHLGQEGYLLNLEFREGETHSQNGTAAFLQRSFSLLPQLPHHHYLLRMDGGFDSVDNLNQIVSFNRSQKDGIHIDFIIKRNLRKESKGGWLHVAREHGVATTVRPGKNVYVGKTNRKVDGFDQPLEIVYQVIERTITAKGQHLLVPEIQVETFWNSLDAAPEKVIELYQHHGTSEQFHSEFKSDMGLERLPSGYFQTNTRIMFLALLAFNLLRIIGQESLSYDGSPIPNRHRIRRRRLRSVIQDIIYLAARLIRHARGWILGFGYQSPYYSTFCHLYWKWAG
jgi:hypothetical protein